MPKQMSSHLLLAPAAGLRWRRRRLLRRQPLLLVRRHATAIAKARVAAKSRLTHVRTAGAAKTR